MHDMKIVKLKNGATLLYQHQNLNNTTQAVIGFKTGSRCDGDFKGMTHLIEHLWFSGNKKYSDEEVFKFTKTTNTNHGATTSYNFVYTSLDCVTDHLDKMLEYNTEAMLNNTFTKQRIDQEIEVISEEILLSQSSETPLTIALGYINKEYNGSSIVGTKEILYQITPEMIKEYTDKYFIAENLIASVVSNLTLEEIVEKFNNTKIANIPSNKENEVPFILPEPYVCSDSYFLNYAYGTPNVSLNIISPVKFTGELEYLNEIDIDILKSIEQLKFNDFSGKLYQKNRIENQLAYSSYFNAGQSPDTMINIFNSETSPNKVNACILALADCIREARIEGVTESDYNDLIELYKSSLSREYNKNVECGDANFNVETVIKNEFVYDTKDIINRIQLLGREYFDRLFKAMFSQNNLILCVNGDFDVKRLPCINQIKDWAFNDNPDRSLISYTSITDEKESSEALHSLISYYESVQNEVEKANNPQKSLKQKIAEKLKKKNKTIEENLEYEESNLHTL